MHPQTFKYSLDKTSKKFRCPQCGHKTFVKYKDDQGNYLADHTGRCDRQNRCAHHCTPKQYFAEQRAANPQANNNTWQQIPAAPAVDYIDARMMHQTFTGVMQTSFMQYIDALFKQGMAAKLAQRYNIGRSRLANGDACIFWQVDVDGNVRSGKIVAYNPATGKRIKAAEVETTGHGLRNNSGEYVACLSVNHLVKKAVGNNKLNFKQCFFGEHLLTRYPNKTVGIVESEKTAVICTVYQPNMVWLATGGVSGCGWRNYDVYKVLENRHVIFYPDHGYYNQAKQTTCFTEWTERVKHMKETLAGQFAVSDFLEQRLSDQPRNDQDLADVILHRDPDMGIALNEHGYPLIWEVNEKEVLED